MSKSLAQQSFQRQILFGYLTICRGNKDYHYEYSIVPVRAAAGKLVGVGVVLRNITRLRERATEKLESSDRELLDVAQEEVMRLKHLVGELLDLTKGEERRLRDPTGLQVD